MSTRLQADVAAVNGAPSIEQRLAAFVAGLTLADVSDEARETAKKAIVDTIAAIVAGTRSELAPAVYRYTAAEQGGGHAVFGSSTPLPADKAALANATLGHALDYDDVVSAMPGHPSAIIVPVLLACSELAPASGEQFLTAYVAGFEVATKMGMAMGSAHYRRGWHSTGTLGIFGACAAAVRMLGCDEPTVVNALGIVASMAAAVRINFGTMTKPLHSGWAAAAGLTAARLAAAGFTSAPDALSADAGFFAVYEGDPASASERLAALGAPLTLESPGISLKKYPCCYALHRVIDALDGLRREGQLVPEEIRTITAAVPPGSLLPVPYTRPRTGFEARFSIQYVLASGMIDGDFSFHTFTDDAVRRPRVLELIERTDAIEDLACAPYDPEGRTASAGTRGVIEVRVERVDGERVVRRVEVPPGSPRRPLGWSDLAAKLADCAEFAGLQADAAARALALVRELETLPDVARLRACLSADRFDAPEGDAALDASATAAAHVASGDEV